MVCALQQSAARCESGCLMGQSKPYYLRDFASVIAMFLRVLWWLDCVRSLCYFFITGSELRVRLVETFWGKKPLNFPIPYSSFASYWTCSIQSLDWRRSCHGNYNCFDCLESLLSYSIFSDCLYHERSFIWRGTWVEQLCLFGEVLAKALLWQWLSLDYLYFRRRISKITSGPQRLSPYPYHQAQLLTWASTLVKNSGHWTQRARLYWLLDFPSRIVACL